MLVKGMSVQMTKMKKTDKKEDKLIAFTVQTEDTLLNFLLNNIKGKSRNNIKSLLSRGDIRVNSKMRKQFDYELRQGDKVAIQPKKDEKEMRTCQLKIVYENDDLVVVLKPEGLLTVATDTEKYKTAYRYLNEYVRETDINNRIYIVHRLDRETSGLLVFAKTVEMKEALQENWNELVTHRGYIAVVEGKVEKQSDQIITNLRETKTGFVYSAPNRGEGIPAITNYVVKEQNEEYSLLEVSLDTGRKNQIRVHMSEMGHPIVGDRKYGAKSHEIRRLCLHAKTLKFTNPLTGEELSFTAPSPASFSRLCK